MSSENNCATHSSKKIQTTCPLYLTGPCIAFSTNCMWSETEKKYKSTHKLDLDLDPGCNVCQKIAMQDSADITFYIGGDPKEKGEDGRPQTWDEYLDSDAWNVDRQSPYFSPKILIKDVSGSSDKDKKTKGDIVALIAKTGTLNFIQGDQTIKRGDALSIKRKGLKSNINFVTIKLSTPGHINLAIWDVDANQLWFFDPHSGTPTGARTRRRFEPFTECATKDKKGDLHDRLDNGICIFFEALGRLNSNKTWSMRSFHTVNIQASKEDELCQTWTLYWIYKIFIEGVPPRGETATAEVAEQAVKEVEAKCDDPNANRVECGWATAKSLEMIHAFGQWLTQSNTHNWQKPPYRFSYIRKGRGGGNEFFESDSEEKTFTTTEDGILIKNVEYPRTERRDRSKGQSEDLRRWNERICQMNLNLKQLLNCKMEGHTIDMFDTSYHLN